MKPCIYLKDQTVNKIASWILLIGLSLLTLSALVLAFLIGLDQTWLLCILSGMLTFFAAVPGWLMNTRTYRVTKQGIEVGGPLRRTQAHTWDRICHIGIYAYGSNASMRSYFSGIFLFLEPVPDYFALDARQGYFSLARRWRSLILIDHSQAVLDELNAAYPGEIQDHRP